VLATVLALLASIMWGSYDFGNGVLSRRTSFWTVVLVVTATAAVAMLLTVVLLDRPAPSATVMVARSAGCSL
jgi:hypothetical protein